MWGQESRVKGKGKSRRRAPTANPNGEPQRRAPKANPNGEPQRRTQTACAQLRAPTASNSTKENGTPNFARCAVPLTLDPQPSTLDVRALHCVGSRGEVEVSRLDRRHHLTGIRRLGAANL